MINPRESIRSFRADEMAILRQAQGFLYS